MAPLGRAKPAEGPKTTPRRVGVVPGHEQVDERGLASPGLRSRGRHDDQLSLGGALEPQLGVGAAEPQEEAVGQRGGGPNAIRVGCVAFMNLLAAETPTLERWPNRSSGETDLRLSANPRGAINVVRASRASQGALPTGQAAVPQLGPPLLGRDACRRRASSCAGRPGP